MKNTHESAESTTSRDFRSLDQTTQAELRRLAYRELDAGRSRQEVANTLEVHINTVGIWSRRSNPEKGMGRKGDERQMSKKCCPTNQKKGFSKY